jgi:hypothetical protein
MISDNDKMNLWDMTVHQIKERDSLDGFYYDLIQEISNEYISKLKDDEVLRTWKETETGMNSNVESENVPIDSLKFDLEEKIILNFEKMAGHNMQCPLIFLVNV